MSVLSVSLPAARVGVLNIASLKYGVEVELIDVDGATAYVDLEGEFDKSLRACLGAGVTVLDSIQSIPGEPEGTGLPTPHVTDQYGSLMGRPK